MHTQVSDAGKSVRLYVFLWPNCMLKNKIIFIGTPGPYKKTFLISQSF